jgi:hypothetical protein
LPLLVLLLLLLLLLTLNPTREVVVSRQWQAKGCIWKEDQKG